MAEEDYENTINPLVDVFWNSLSRGDVDGCNQALEELDVAAPDVSVGAESEEGTLMSDHQVPPGRWDQPSTCVLYPGLISSLGA